MEEEGFNSEADPGNPRYIISSQLGLRRQSLLKVAPNRGPKRALWVDWLHYEVLSCPSASLKYFPANATDLVQPADSYIISKIKEAWSSSWNQKKIETIRANKWQDKVRSDGPGRKNFPILERNIF